MEDHEKRTSSGADTDGKTDESTSTQTTSSRGEEPAPPQIIDLFEALKAALERKP